MKHIQFILNEIARRYDQGYADHIWTATQIKFAADYASSMEEDGGLLQLVALYRVMDEEGFSHSERGAIFAALFEDVKGQSLSAEAWTEVLDMPVYGTSSFSTEVSGELRRHADLGQFLE